MKTSNYLKAAKAKIENPAFWIKGQYAQDAMGNFCWGADLGATCFCSAGAIQAVRNDDTEMSYPEYLYLYKAVQIINPAHKSVPAFNDHSSHEEVMAMWDKAIELAEKDEAELVK